MQGGGQATDGLAPIAPEQPLTVAQGFKAAQGGFRPLAAEGIRRQSQGQGLAILLQAPPLHRQAQASGGLEQGGGIGASAHGHFHHHQLLARPPTLELAGPHEFLLGLAEGASGAVESLAEGATPKTEAAVGTAAGRQ